MAEAKITVMPIARRAKAFQFRTWIDGETSLPTADVSHPPPFDPGVKCVDVRIDGLDAMGRATLAAVLCDAARAGAEVFGYQALHVIALRELAEAFR